MSLKQVVIIIDDFSQNSISNYSNVSLYDYGYFTKYRSWDYYLNSNYSVDGYGDIDYTEQISTTTTTYYPVNYSKQTGQYVALDNNGTGVGLGNYVSYYQDYYVFNPIYPQGYQVDGLQHGDWVLYSFEKQLDDTSSVEVICVDIDGSSQYTVSLASIQSIVEGWMTAHAGDGKYYIPTTFSISYAGNPIGISEISALSWMIANNIVVAQSAPNVNNGDFDWGMYYPDVVNVGAWNVDSSSQFLGASLTTLGSVKIYANGYVFNNSWTPVANFGTSFATPRVAAEIVNTFKVVFDEALRLYASGQLTSEQLKTNIGYSEIVKSIISTISKNIYVQDNGAWLINPLKVMADDVLENSGPYIVPGGGGLQSDKITSTSFVSPFDTDPPLAITFSPSDEATSVGIGSNIAVTFSEGVQRGAGDIVLKTSAGTMVATFGQISPNVTISGSTLTINPTADLNYSTAYKVEFAAGSVQDLAGNNYAGTSSYNFTTGAAPDTTPPVVSTFSPLDEATGVGIDTNITVTFSENVQRGAGDIVLKTAAGTTIATYSQTSSNVTISGSTLTINPTADLNYSTAYKVEFAAGSVRDLAGNDYTGTSAYNYTTDAQAALKVNSGAFVSGLISQNTIWDGDITLTGSVKISPNVSLTILPGSHISAQAGKSIMLWADSGARLYASGSAQSPITFESTGDGSGQWMGIRLSGNIVDSNDPRVESKLSYVNVKEATVGVHVSAQGLSIENSIFNDNSYGVWLGKDVNGINILGSSFDGAGVVTSYESEVVGPYGSSNSWGSINNVKITDNNFTNASIALWPNQRNVSNIEINNNKIKSPGVALMVGGGGYGSHIGGLSVYDNEIIGQTGFSIRAYSWLAGGVEVKNNKFSPGTAGTNTGVYLDYTQSQPNRFVIEGNSFVNESFAIRGIDHNTSAAVLDIKGNQFIGNGTSIDIPKAKLNINSNTFIGNTSYIYDHVYTTSNFTNNNIFNFKGVDGFVRTRESAGGSSVNFTGNYFDSNSAKQVDYADDGSENFLYPIINFTENQENPDSVAVGYWPAWQNSRPVVNDVSIVSREDQISSGQLVASDVDSDALVYSKISNPTNGAIVINSAGAYAYTPNANFNGSDSFTFKVNDGTQDSAVATVSLTISPVNDAPIANSIEISTNEDTVKTGALTAIDVDSPLLTYAKVSAPTNGKVVINSDGTYTYTPNSNFNGSDSFTFKANDGLVDSATATVTITVVPVNDAPVIANSQVVLKSPQEVWTKLLGAEASDEANVVKIGKDGGIYVLGSGQIPISQGVDANSPDAFLSRFEPDGSQSWLSKLGLDMTGMAAQANSMAVSSDGSIYVAGYTQASLDGQANNGDRDGFLMKFSPQGAKVWTKLIGTTAQDEVFAVATDANGNAILTGQTRGGQLSGGAQSVGTGPIFISKISPDGNVLWISQTGGNPGWEFPSGIALGVDGSAYVTGSTAYGLNGQSNAGSYDAFVMKFTSAGQAAWTRLLGSNSGDMAKAIEVGSDGGVYILGLTSTGLEGQSGIGGIDSFITKLSAGGEKVWTRIHGSTESDEAYSLAASTDGLIYASGYAPIGFDGIASNGGADAYVTQFSGDGSKGWTMLLGTPWYDNANAIQASSDGYIYVVGATAGDLSGQKNANKGIADVGAFPGMPGIRTTDAFISKYSVINTIGSSAQTIVTNEDTAKTGVLSATDVDSTQLTYLKVSDPANGSVVINSNGTYTYTPKTNFNGTDSFTFKANDGSLDSAAANVLVTVSPVNDVPVATPVSATTNEDTAKTGTLAGIDVEGSALSFSKVADPQNGTVTIDAATGAYTYTPKANFNGSDSFTFKVNDGTADSSVATVAITVRPVNDVPSGTVDFLGTPKQGETLTANMSWSDADGVGALSYQWMADGADISGAINASLTLTQSEVGKAISVKVSYVDGGGTPETLTSVKTAAVAPLKAGITWSGTSSLSTNESGTSAFFGSVLDKAPSKDVTLTLTISDASEGVFVSTGTTTRDLVFTPSNWNQVQNVQVKGVDDSEYDRDVAYTISTKVTSNDLDYDGMRSGQGLATANVTVTNLDDDIPINWIGTDANDVKTGGPGADDLYGGYGRDDISGGNGNDRIYGGYGDDVLSGGDGNDEIEGDQGDDRLIGDAGDDNLKGGTGADTLLGGDGNDILNGGEDADSMDGGNGADVYYIDNPGDVVEDSGTDSSIDILYIASYLSAPVVLGRGIENATLNDSAGKGSITGNDSNNSLNGNASDNLLSGGAGNDTMESGAGNDSVDAGTGDDLIVGGEGAGNDTYVGGTGTDTVKYTSAVNTILVNLLEGMANGQDIGTDKLSEIENLIGGQAGDTLIGDTNANNISAYTGNDTITGNGGNDTIDGGEGQDTVVYALSASNYTVTAITGGYQVVAKTGTEGTDTLLNVESLKFADKSGSIADFQAKEVVPASAKFWKDSKAPSDIKKTDAVNLTDAIAILKMIVGLNVNSNGVPLSPYQSIAADFDQSGEVNLTDAIGVLKMVVGLSAPTPTWKYYDDTKLASAYTSAQSLNPKGWTTTAAISDTGTADSGVKLVGVLTGDVDGSWTGA